MFSTRAEPRVELSTWLPKGCMQPTSPRCCLFHCCTAGEGQRDGKGKTMHCWHCSGGRGIHCLHSEGLWHSIPHGGRNWEGAAKEWSGGIPSVCGPGCMRSGPFVPAQHTDPNRTVLAYGKNSGAFSFQGFRKPISLQPGPFQPSPTMELKAIAAKKGRKKKLPVSEAVCKSVFSS